tara:strand:+ start:55 stop:609 length:555 start_codon:yes stop_codon:yes gene_type:complete
MHYLKIFHFIDEYKESYLEKIDKNVILIYRKYSKPTNIIEINKIKNYCKKRKIKFLIANDLKTACKLNLDGYYIPSFNKDFLHINRPYKRNFLIVGSAHNTIEIKIKEKQKCKLIFLSPIFYVKKNLGFLGLNKFRLLSNTTKTNIIALGGINTKNFKKLITTNCSGYASISMIKKKAQNKSGP